MAPVNVSTRLPFRLRTAERALIHRVDRGETGRRVQDPHGGGRPDPHGLGPDPQCGDPAIAPSMSQKS